MKQTILKVVAVLLALAVVFPAFAGGSQEPVKQSVLFQSICGMVLQ